MVSLLRFMFLRHRDTIFYFIYMPSLASEAALCSDIYSYTQQAGKFFCFYNLIFFFLAVPHGLWALNSLTKVWTCAIGMKRWSPNHRITREICRPDLTEADSVWRTLVTKPFTLTPNGSSSEKTSQVPLLAITPSPPTPGVPHPPLTLMTTEHPSLESGRLPPIAHSVTGSELWWKVRDLSTWFFPLCCAQHIEASQ